MKTLAIGSITQGVITGIKPYGAFVQLDLNCTGLIHISEISSGYVNNVGSYVKIGDTVVVKVIDIDETNHQVRLSLKAVQEMSARARYRQQVRRPLKMRIGFQSIQQILPLWINEAMKEINDDQI